MIASLVGRLRPRPPRAAHVVVSAYTRAGCGCCESALGVLRAGRDRLGYRLQVLDVDADPDAARDHGAAVPVVLVDGKVRFRGEVNPTLLDRLIVAIEPPAGAPR